jgi:hypothetical protein
MANTIVLSQELGGGQHEELRASGTIRPGHLCQRQSDGTVVVHATAGGDAEMLIAKEDSLQGRTIDDNYVSGELVFLHRARRGDKINALIPAGAAAFALTDFLTPNGDGTFKKAAGADVKRAKPLEAKDNSAGGAPVRCMIVTL